MAERGRVGGGSGAGRADEGGGGTWASDSRGAIKFVTLVMQTRLLLEGRGGGGAGGRPGGSRGAIKFATLVMLTRLGGGR